ncbi:unnamed protein product [Mycena citricolor]|uniref:acetyl-CoA C-acetyltransferase n=1 Tax=Mycena citricolor TaxID=2018698 RepID=A0AAD2HKG8_9AGAR|nr:unnamed protein product [Mycena citricolor]
MYRYGRNFLLKTTPSLVPSHSTLAPRFSRTMVHEAVIVAASRTPTGSLNGTLKSFKAPELGTAALKHALASKNIDPAVVEELYFGNVVQAGVGQSPARQVALSAGLSSASDATTINKVCASGMKAVMLAAQAIQTGDKNVVAAGGMESMSNAPFLLPRQNPLFGKFTTIDSLETDGLWDVYNNQAMGCCGESAAVKIGITREAQDAHAIESYKRSERAWASGAFDAEICPITVKGKKGDTIIREDEEYKRVIYDKVPSLRSAFKQGGSITAANSSPLSDGASALVLMSAEKAQELGLTPLAKVISFADAGVEPVDFPIAPTVALPKALERANLKVEDISLFEINEAFSVVVRIAEKVLTIDPAKINVNGGAVALGHAIGSSGARIIVSLVHALKSGQYGAAGVCNGVRRSSFGHHHPKAMTPEVVMEDRDCRDGYFLCRTMSEPEKASLADAVADNQHASFDANDGDEALRLVGAVRTTQFSEEYNLKLRRKLDLLIPPLCAAVYFTQFLDKTSLNYASIMGLPIKGQQYNLVSAAFYFAGFLFFEFPTVYIAQKLRLAKYLGMCECCVAPILILIISMFYKKNEQASRIAWFYVMNGLTQIFGGFVAYGISFDPGRRLAPYKIIYILLGGLAILVGIAVLIWMPDSPVHAHFLTTEERIAALERVRDDQGGTENKRIKREQVREAVLDVRTWLIVLTTLVTSIPNGALSNFSNIIIKSFGYSSRQTLILSTPGGVVSAVTTLLYSTQGERMLPIIFALVPTIVGSGMLIGLSHANNKGAELFAVYLVNTFGSALAQIYAYNASNTSGHTKKNTVNAMTLVSFAVGNIIGTQIFAPGDAPAYIPGKTAIMVLLTVQLFISLLLRWVNLRLNAKKRAQLAELTEKNGWTDDFITKERQRNAFADMTDKQNVFFVYTG